MTEVFNFFQAMFIPRSFAPARINKQEADLAISLRREAQKFAVNADEEMRSGNATQTLALEATEKEKVQIFARIAVWHSNRAAQRYRQAAARFEEAGKVQVEKTKTFNLLAKEMKRRAVQAETAVSLLEAFPA